MKIRYNVFFDYFDTKDKMPDEYDDEVMYRYYMDEIAQGNGCDYYYVTWADSLEDAINMMESEPVDFHDCEWWVAHIEKMVENSDYTWDTEETETGIFKIERNS